MTSLCNYSHPELFNTDGLTRDGVGTLFPYHPEMYDSASGLYGPGSIICWYLLLGSFIVNFTLCQVDADGVRRPSVTTDLIALTIYPVFAATDALIQAFKMLGMPDRGSVLFCLRYPMVDLSLTLHGPGEPGDAPLDLHNIPQDAIEYGQRIIALTGPMPVCYMFTTVIVLSLIGALMYSQYEGHSNEKYPVWKVSRGVWRLVGFAYGYVFLCLTILQFSLVEWIIVIEVFYECTTPIIFGMLHGFGLASYLAIFTALCIMVLRIVRCFRGLPMINPNDPDEPKENICSLLGGMIGIALIGGVPCALAIWKGDLSVTPDLGISITESDQLAALLAGIATPCFTIYSILSRKQSDSAQSGEELQPLASEV